MTTQDEGAGAAVERIGPSDYDYTPEELDGVSAETEQAGLLRQITALTDVSGGEELRRIVGRRRDRDDHTGVVPLNEAAGVYAADGEVLVLGGGPTDADAQDGFLPDGFVRRPSRTVTDGDAARDAFGGRLLRLRPDADAATDPLEGLAAAGAEGLYAAPNHVCTLSPVIKGDGSPESTAVRRRFPIALAQRLGDEGRVQVAIVDTGIAQAPRTDGFLADVTVTDANVDALDVLPSPNGILDLGAGHGTFAAGIIQQICPTADIRVYRAVDTDGVGKEDRIAATMAQAVADGAQILSLSLGTTSEGDVPPLAFRTVLDDLGRSHPDVLVVAAAGNNGDTRPVWPAAFKQVVAVGALTADREPADWSSRGFWVDCSAVGEGVVSTFVPGQELAVLGGSVFGEDAWAMWSGTSFTAPQVAGAVARLVQANRALGWTPRRALQALLDDAVADGGRWLPDYGVGLRLLPGSPRPAGSR